MQLSWIYTLSEALSVSEAEGLASEVREKLSEWKAHGVKVPGVANILYNRFLVVRALEAPSGCSIDWLQHEINSLLAAKGLKAAENNLVWYVNSEGVVQPIDFRELGTAIAAGLLHAETQVFDTNSYLSGGELQRPLSQTWAARYLPSPVNS
jgi:hypothetical protein